MCRRFWSVFLMVLLGVGVLLAHGNATHLRGTVTAVGADTVTIKGTDGKDVVVMLESGTKYLREKKAAAKSELVVGTRVVIDAKMNEKAKMFAAEEIQLGVNTAARAK